MKINLPKRDLVEEQKQRENALRTFFNHTENANLAKKKIIALFSAAPELADCIINPPVKNGKDNYRYNLLFSQIDGELKRLMPDSFNEDGNPKFGYSKGNGKFKTELGSAMMTIINWAKSSKLKSDPKTKTLDDLTGMIADMFKMIHKNGIDKDQAMRKIITETEKEFSITISIAEKAKR